MIITREEMRKTRLSLVHQMHDYIMNTGDEEIFEIWLRDAIPDCPCEEDFEFFAEDADEFKELCNLFGKLVYVDETENY